MFAVEAIIVAGLGVWGFFAIRKALKVVTPAQAVEKINN